MIRTVITTTAVLVICLTQLVQAQAPASMPTSAPAADGPVDQSTPQGTLILLTRAMQNGDVAGTQQLLHATTPDETVLASLFVRVVEVNAKFRSSVGKAFGDGVADSIVGSAADVAATEKGFRAAKVEIKDDKATVFPRPGDEPVQLVRADGKWKLSMNAVAAEDMARTQEDLKIRLGVLDGVATDVAAGSFKSPEEMENAIRTRLAAAVFQAAAAASPATRPGAPDAGK